ncbi:hydroxyethylthiazole kinase [Acidobacteriota bacterium]
MEHKISIKEFNSQAVKDLGQLRENKSLVHNITNYVVMNYTAMALLAIGASPIMAHSHEEVEELTSFSGALVLNIGTLTPYWVDSMVMAGRKANEKGVPVILDPVGSGATRLRTESAKRIIEQVDISVIRGNASEILSLADTCSKTKGVDSIHSVDEAAEAGQILAQELDTVLAITGKVDLITDGSTTFRVQNGHPMMGMVTGTGCTATAVIAAFHAVNTDSLVAATEGLAFFGLAGEKAADEAKAPGSYQVKLLDYLYLIDGIIFGKGIRVTLDG